MGFEIFLFVLFSILCFYKYLILFIYMRERLEIKEINGAAVGYIVDHFADDGSKADFYTPLEGKLCEYLSNIEIGLDVAVVNSLEGGLRGTTDVIINSRKGISSDC